MRLLLRRDPFRRFYSCLVFVPREKYNTQVRQRIERVIGDALVGGRHGIAGADRRVESRAHPHRRAHAADRVGAHRRRCARAAQSPLAVRSWADDFKAALLARFDEAYALHLFDDLRAGLSRRLHRGFSGEAAALDVTFLEAADKRAASGCTWTSIGPTRAARTNSS